jgi:hypothetical protein
MTMRIRYVLKECVFVSLLGVFVGLNSGCALRTVPPIRFLPILGKEKTVQTTDVLMRLLKDRDRAVRAGAVDLLGDLGQTDDKKLKKEVARVLGMAMKDRDPGLRVQVVQKLGSMEAVYANKYLMNALKDPHPFVRTEVLTVIANRERGTALPGSPLSAQITP